MTTFLDLVRKTARERKDGFVEKGGGGSGWYAPPKGTHTEGAGAEGESARGEAWTISATEWIDEGHTIPPEIYNGLPHVSGGRIEVKKHKDGTYTVIHNYPGTKVKGPLVTRADKTVAIDQCIRAYGKVLNNDPSTVIKQHRRLVLMALKTGKPVPEKILKDYPDLRRHVKR